MAGGRLFRWDAQQRFVTRGGYGWLGVALASWVAVGVVAEYRGDIRIETPPESVTGAASGAQATPVVARAPASAAAASGAVGTGAAIAPAPASAPPTSAIVAAPGSASGTSTAANAGPTPPPPAGTPPATLPPSSPPPTAASTATPADPNGWRAVTLKDIDEELVFTRLPPDSGVVTPVASANDDVDNDTLAELDALRTALETWEPGKDPDPVQRVRNVLFVASVIDVFQMPTESLVPLVVFAYLEQAIPRDDLVKILYWVAIHPDDGFDAAVDQMRSLGVSNGPSDMAEVRGRTGVYAVKLIGRITGKRPGR